MISEIDFLRLKRHGIIDPNALAKRAITMREREVDTQFRETVDALVKRQQALEERVDPLAARVSKSNVVEPGLQHLAETKTQLHTLQETRSDLTKTLKDEQQRLNQEKLQVQELRRQMDTLTPELRSGPLYKEEEKTLTELGQRWVGNIGGTQPPNRGNPTRRMR
jgi:DNA repair exonuclease SbcCD ATPase subunit